MNLFKPKEAAQIIGVSYPTIKQWIYAKKIRSVTTAGGHHRIPEDEVQRFSRPDPVRDGEIAKPLSSISGRNKLYGTITDLRIAGLLAQVIVDIGGQTITSIITSDSARNLGLKKGVKVYALVKATEVMIIRD